MSLCYNCFTEIYDAVQCPHCGYKNVGEQKRFPGALAPGTFLGGRYLIGRVLHEDDFSYSYAALDDTENRRVIIKEYYPKEFVIRTGTAVSLLYAGFEADYAVGKRDFLDEAKALTTYIGSPGLIWVYGSFELNRTAYMVTEYVEGTTLSTYLNQHGGSISFDDAVQLFVSLFDDLSDAHEIDVLHCDICPDNIIVTNSGGLKLINFSYARFQAADRFRRINTVLRDGYAPIELYTNGARPKTHCDVYSMAATFYRSITGQTPPRALERMKDDSLPALDGMRGSIPDYSVAAIRRALSLSTSERYPNLDGFCFDLLNGCAYDDSSDQPRPRPVNPHPVHSYFQLTAIERRDAFLPKDLPPKPPIIPDNPPPKPPIIIPEETKKVPAAKKPSPLASVGKFLLAVAVIALVAFVIYKLTDEKLSLKIQYNHLAVGDDFTVGVDSTGQVLYTGAANERLEAVSDWRDIAAISADEHHIVGLKQDGTVVSVADRDTYLYNYSDWNDIAAIDAKNGHTIGLKSDGTVVVAGAHLLSDAAKWKKIKAISSGYYHVVGLKSNGKVVAAGNNDRGQCDVDDWEDITAVAAGYDFTLGLKKDGTVVAAGYNLYGQCDVEEWTDIKAIIAGSNYSIGIKKSGAVVAAGFDYDVQFDFDNWVGIQEIAAGDYHAVGMNYFGKVRAVGDNSSGQCEFSGWDLN